MATKKDTLGAEGKGNVNPVPHGRSETVRVAAEQLVMVPIDDLIPYVNNARIHSKEQIIRIRASLREFGFVTPVLIDFDNNVIAGHGRIAAAKAEGLKEIPCVIVSNLTEAQRKAYILADNRLNEISSWNEAALKIELEGLKALDFDVGLAGFDAIALEEIHVGAHTWAATVPDTDGGEDLPPAEGDAYDGQIPKTCPYKPGDVFKLGRHLLVCGDCTKEETTKIFQRGGGVNMLLTDPPYNVAIGQNESVDQARQRHRRTDGVILENDNMTSGDFRAFLSIRHGSVIAERMGLFWKTTI